MEMWGRYCLELEKTCTLHTQCQRPIASIPGYYTRLSRKLDARSARLLYGTQDSSCYITQNSHVWANPSVCLVCHKKSTQLTRCGELGFAHTHGIPQFCHGFLGFNLPHHTYEILIILSNPLWFLHRFYYLPHRVPLGISVRLSSSITPFVDWFSESHWVVLVVAISLW